MGRPLPRVAGALLVAVTLLLRWPLTPRPTGSDSFEYFVQVASLRDAGAMEWLLHPAAYFGLYPGTSPAGHLALTAAFEETTGLGFEGSALLLSLAISLLGVAGMWLLAGELGVSPAARWLATLSFAVAPRFITFALWRLSLRYLMVVLLLLFLWALLRSQHRRYGRHPARLIALGLALGLALPAVHRMGLLLPGFLLAFALAAALSRWQAGALDRERAARQGVAFCTGLGLYLAYLSYLGGTLYAPSEGLFSVYLFEGETLPVRFANLAVHYGLLGGPLLLLALLGAGGTLQQGRPALATWLALAWLALGAYVILDRIYLVYLLLVGMLLLVGPGAEMLLRELPSRRGRVALVAALFVLSGVSAAVDLRGRIDHMERPETGYSYHVREPTIAAAFWGSAHADGELFEANDIKRTRRVDAYSGLIATRDADGLAQGVIDPAAMELEYLGWRVLFTEQNDHLWTWENRDEFNENISADRSLSLVNLAFPEATGSASIPESIISSTHYRWIDWFCYRVYAGDELAFYWSYGYAV